MSSLCAFILTFSTLCGSRVVSGVLSRPTKVHLTSYNMDLVLKWDPPEGAASGLVYTAEYKSIIESSHKSYRVGCVNISSLECDLTSPPDAIFEYGTYIGRVQAQLGSETSPWVESSNFTVDKDTIIGSPSISLFSNGASIEVSIEDPVFTLSTLREVYSDVTYNITYWKDGQREAAENLSNIHQNRVVLDKLDPLTKYCVQVRINTDWNKNPPELSTTVCETTASEKEIPWVEAVVTFAVLAIAMALLVVTVVYRRSIYHFLCPKDALPEHIKEYLLEPPNLTIYKAMQNPQPPEIIADVTVVEEGPLEVAGSTCSKQPDVTVGER